MVQVPVATSVASDPETVQMLAVRDEKVTANPDDALALNVIGGSPSVESLRELNVMVWPASDTVKLCKTGVAAAYIEFPNWLAWMVQVPVDMSVAVDAETVQTPVVREAKLTVRPEDAVALNVGGGAVMVWAGSELKVIVWLASNTEKLWLTGVAAAHCGGLPPCEAWMVQVPVATRVTVEPDTVQTAVVSEAKLTARPEEAVALTVNGEVPIVWLGRRVKVIVWVIRTLKLCTTGTAGAYVELPGCMAQMPQVPADTSVTVTPEIVQAQGVSDSNPTVRPEDALAVIVNGGAPMGRLGRLLKVIVCVVEPVCAASTLKL